MSHKLSSTFASSLFYSPLPLLPLLLPHLKKISRVSNGSEEVLPQCHLCLSSTGSNCLQKLRKLLDKFNHTRKKSILCVYVCVGGARRGGKGEEGEEQRQKEEERGGRETEGGKEGSEGKGEKEFMSTGDAPTYKSYLH